MSTTRRRRCMQVACFVAPRYSSTSVHENTLSPTIFDTSSLLKDAWRLYKYVFVMYVYRLTTWYNTKHHSRANSSIKPDTPCLHFSRWLPMSFRISKRAFRTPSDCGMSDIFRHTKYRALLRPRYGGKLVARWWRPILHWKTEIVPFFDHPWHI